LTPTPAAGETRKGAATTVDLSYGWGGTTAIQTWDALGKKMGADLTAFNVRWIVGDNGTKLVTAVAGGSPRARPGGSGSPRADVVAAPQATSVMASTAIAQRCRPPANSPRAGMRPTAYALTRGSPRQCWRPGVRAGMHPANPSTGSPGPAPYRTAPI